MWCNQLRRQDFFSPHSILRLKQKMSNKRKLAIRTQLGLGLYRIIWRMSRKKNLAFWADCTTCFKRRKETQIPNFPQVLLFISMFFFSFFLNSFWTSIYNEKRLCLCLFFQIMLQHHLLLVCETSAILYSNCFERSSSEIHDHVHSYISRTRISLECNG